MRFLIPFAPLLLAACSSETAPAPDALAALPAGNYTGGGRDSLCVSAAPSGQHTGFVTYGSGNENCSARGSLVKQGVIWTLTPDGDPDCRIPLSLNAGTLALGPATPTCTYYCAPGESFAGRTFKRDQSAKPATDFGGDRLC